MGNLTPSWAECLEVAPNEEPKASSLSESVSRFDNLHAAQIEALWRSFCESASSFAISKLELRSIFSAITSLVVSIHSSFAETLTAIRFLSSAFIARDTIVPSAPPLEAQQEMEGLSDAFFDHWAALAGKDMEGVPEALLYIDALEVILALLFTSKMPLPEKVDFLFDCMDYDGDSDLDLREFTLSLKSAEAGLAKLRGKQPAMEQKIQDLACRWYKRMLGQEDDDALEMKASRR
ncbi:unnamed protein product, partial [Phaeothamnion confervicola]